MVNSFIYFGLIAIPFFLVKGYDSRYPKEMLSIGISCFIAFYCLYNGLLKPFKNKWFFITMGFMFLALSQIPETGIAFGIPQNGMFAVFGDRMELDGIWNYKPILYCIIYLLLLISIISSQLKIKNFFNIITWVGFVMAWYVLIQKIGFEQYMTIKTTKELGFGVIAKNLIGTMGQPTILSSFLTICLPFAYFNKKWFHVFIISIAAILTQGTLAVAMTILVALLMNINNKSLFIGTIIIIAVAGLIFALTVKKGANGRNNVWQDIITDLKGQNLVTEGFARPMTGFGAGAFHYMYPTIHQSRWRQAHNEYLEFTYNNGVIGLLLFLGAIWSVMKTCWDRFYIYYMKPLVVSLIVILISACGLFVWQLHAHIFYTIVILGTIYSLTEGNTDVAKE